MLYNKKQWMSHMKLHCELPFPIPDLFKDTKVALIILICFAFVVILILCSCNCHVTNTLYLMRISLYKYGTSSPYFITRHQDEYTPPTRMRHMMEILGTAASSTTIPCCVASETRNERLNQECFPPTPTSSSADSSFLHNLHHKKHQL